MSVKAESQVITVKGQINPIEAPRQRTQKRWPFAPIIARLVDKRDQIIVLFK